MDISPRSLRIALTADLHYGTRHTAGNRATQDIAAHLYENQPDVLILGGDIGAGDDFARCLDLFENLSCLKLLVPGNHDIWVTSDDERGNSLRVYQEVLPRWANEHGFHYLDHGPLLLPEASLAIAGSINWYDYSWAIEDLKRLVPDWEMRMRTKRFTRGRHNDAQFVRWPYSDISFTREVVATLIRHIDEGLAQMEKAIVITHHPSFRGLNYPAADPFGLDEMMWRAFSGNETLESALLERSQRIPFTFCGHTHHARNNMLGHTRGINIGGDYHAKRLIYLNWPGGQIETLAFG